MAAEKPLVDEFIARPLPVGDTSALCIRLPGFKLDPGYTAARAVWTEGAEGRQPHWQIKRHDAGKGGLIVWVKNLRPEEDDACLVGFVVTKVNSNSVNARAIYVDVPRSTEAAVKMKLGKQ